MPGDESIRIMCPKLGCQRVLAVPATARGLIVRCCGCGSKLRIPQAQAAVRAMPAGGAATAPTSSQPAPPNDAPRRHAA